MDEQSTLQYLPQLKAAYAESRKSDLTIVSGFQGRADIEAIYGKPAETMFSAPYTKLLLRSSEPGAAEWEAKMVGRQKRECIRETRGIGRQKHSYTIEQREEFTVMDSAFQCLPDREGYLKYGGNVVKIKLPIIPARKRAVDFVPRKGEAFTQLPLPNLEEIKAKEEAERHAKAFETAGAWRPSSAFHGQKGANA